MRLHVILHFFVVTPKSDPFRPFDKTSFLQTFFFSALTNITVPGLGQGVWSEPAGCPWKGGWKKVTVVSRERKPGWHAKTGALGPSTLITRMEFGLDVVFFLCYIPWSSCRATTSCWRLEMLDGDVFFCWTLKIETLCGVETTNEKVAIS